MRKKAPKPTDLCPRYLIMDGRAIHNLDDATVLACSSTLQEAKRDAQDFGGVIYDCEVREVIL